jgi:hypothetical protein
VAKQAPAYDVIATLRGSEEPDQWVIRGNHHDAWVNGATDPSSGMAAVLAEAKAISELVAQGWKPRRTIVFAAWDAEEPGLLGSTEWVEDHARELGAKAVAYVNSDSNARGFLDMSGSHSLQRLLNQVARDVADPVKGTSRTAPRAVLRGGLEGHAGEGQARGRGRASTSGLRRRGGRGQGRPFTSASRRKGTPPSEGRAAGQPTRRNGRRRGSAAPGADGRRPCR